MIKVASRLVPYYDNEGFDALICDEKNLMFAVFDGMGTSEDSREAALLCRKFFTEMAVTGETKHFNQLASAINYVTHVLREDQTNHGGSTATVVVIDDEGTLHYAHCGDSRLYVMDGGRIKQVTADEGYDNILYNYVGTDGKGCVQLGYVDDWDVFMLCTDGVTGDRGEDRMSDTVLQYALDKLQEPEIAIDSILEVSTKMDDKAIIIGDRHA